MRILTIHEQGRVRGGADAVYLHGTRLLAKQGHTIAWMNPGICEAATASEKVYSLSETSSLRSFKRNVRIAAGLIYLPEARRLARRAVQEFRPDVVHVHTIGGAFSPIVACVFADYGIPVVQTLHDYRLLCPVCSFLSGDEVCEACHGRHYYHCVMRRCARNRALLPSIILGLGAYISNYIYHYDKLINHYICPGEFLRQKMIAFGYASEKLTTLPNAYFGPSLAHREMTEPLILYVGRLSHEKGVDLLVKAARGLKTPVCIVGDGPARPDLEELADALGVADQVKFLGFQTFAQVQELYARAWVNVLPSRWYENGPLVVLEANAQGTPVVASAMGALPEFVEEGKTGCLFTANDAESLREVLQRCLARPDWLREMGENARQRVIQRYSPERYAQGLETILERVIL